MKTKLLLSLIVAGFTGICNGAPGSAVSAPRNSASVIPAAPMVPGAPVFPAPPVVPTAPMVPGAPVFPASPAVPAAPVSSEPLYR